MKKLVFLLILSAIFTLALSQLQMTENEIEMLTRNRRSSTSKGKSDIAQSRSSSRRNSRLSSKATLLDVDESLESAAQTQRASRRQKSEPRLGFSGTVVDGKSAYILKYNEGVPIYGAGEPYYFSYTHNFPIATSDFQSLVNSHNLPKKYKFSGGLDVTGLLE